MQKCTIAEIMFDLIKFLSDSKNPVGVGYLFFFSSASTGIVYYVETKFFN